MKRPLRLFAHRLAKDRHIDVDVIMAWPLAKLAEHMAFERTENEDFQKQLKKDTPISFDEIVRLMEQEGVIFK